jgi:uncharacterized protein
VPTLEAARRWYPESDPVHGFDHVLRVYWMAELIARQEGADLEIVRAAVLLHDAQEASDTAPVERASHHQASADFARRVLEMEGWQAERIAAVEHCIRAHRFRDESEQPETLEAQVLFDADKLDAIGATGVARAVAFAARLGMPAYAPPSESFVRSGTLEPGELHSAYHEYLFKLSKLKDRMHTRTAWRIAAERHAVMADYFEQLIAESQPPVEGNG